MPGSNSRALDKGRSLPCDVLILDCEDAVAPDHKILAREQIANAITSGSFGDREVVVRINSLGSPWGKEDCLTMAEAGATAILIPKAESEDDVTEVGALIREACHGREGTVPQVWCMIETPKGVLRAEQLASMDTVTCLVAGTSDLAADLRCDGVWKDRTALLHSLSHIVLAARAHGVAVLDGVHLDLGDDEGFEASCLQGKSLGFCGKTLIHPKTIEAANVAFSPSEEDVAQARRKIEAFAEAQASGSALVVLDGKLVEELHVREAKRLVQLADAIAIAA